ncbi:MAG: peptide ABC transporter substrate-binding protein [Planctomycetales bacterium]|nr:peptide ABC transporter substrate-binding protein [Planctomycetales bacterium]
MLFLRKAFPYLAIALGLASLAWAVSFGTLPKADFAFENGNEIQTADPSKATGQPENRIINGLFEGLLRSLPDEGWEKKYGPGENVPMTPRPAMAERYGVSEDGRTYTFHMRKGALWSNGDPVTADDFAWSWRRMLHPETASQYAYQLYYLVGAEDYNTGKVETGSLVELELDGTRRDKLQAFPRGTMLRGKVLSLKKPPEPPELAKDSKANDEAKSKAEDAWKKGWVYRVILERVEPSTEDANPKQFAGGETIDCCVDPAKGKSIHSGQLVKVLHVLPDFDRTVGVKAESPEKLIVTLKSRTAFFNELVAFYPLYPVNRKCVEEHGSPYWTKPQNLVCNGPYTMQFRRIRDRIRLVKNPKYWDAEHVHLNVIDAMAVKSETTTLNMYLNNQIDWATQAPPPMIPTLKEKIPAEFPSAPTLIVYLYRINVTKPGLGNRQVRQALNLAIDKKNICEIITRAGEVPATGVVPPGLAGYTPAVSATYNPEAARKLLADAGFPSGRGLSTIEIVYNDTDAHRTIAERIQQMWRENLGIGVQLRGVEWGTYLDLQHKMDYQVARAGWVADYPDPNTFLDMWTSSSQQNQTGWKNDKYDELIAKAGSEADPKKRMQFLHDAEAILIEECPILPIYWYVSKNLVKPHVKGWFLNSQDTHPLTLLHIDRGAAPSPVGGGAR